MSTKTALFLWGGWATHDPLNTSMRFGNMLEKRGYDVTLTNDATILDTDVSTFDLIVVCMTMAEITDQQERNLLAAIANGTGLGGWHGGLGDAFRTRTDFHYAVGGQWVKHPGDTIDYTVNIVESHEITAGVNDFAVRSEQYYMHIDPGVHVLAATTFTGQYDAWIDGVAMPVAWTKAFGKGKVFYCSIGHNNADFDQPDATRLIEQGLVWATR